MRRFLLAGSLTLALGMGFGGSAQAGWNEFWARVKQDWQRNNAWPEPFQSADRAAAREPFTIMVNNGWKAQNTVGTFLFDDETHELNHAGELKVKWIITQAPIHRRAVFVLAADAPAQTKVRVESVQRYISKMLPVGALPPVVVTYSEPINGSGEYFDAINRSLLDSIPSPRLPGGEGGSGGGDSGGSSGGM